MLIEQMFYDRESNPRPVPGEVPSSGCSMAIAYAELHCHTQFSMLDGASAPDELVERAAALGMEALAVTDHQGLYGAVRFATAAEEAGIRPIVGVEIELLDAAAPDPGGIVVPARRSLRRGSRAPVDATPAAREGLPARPRPRRARLPGHRAYVKEDLRGVGEAQRGPHLVLLARNAAGYRSLARLVSRANLAGTKAVPRFDHALLAAHTEGLVALSGCRHGEIARRLRAGDREGARAVAETYARWFGGSGGSVGRTPASSSSSSTTCCPTTTGSSPRARAWRRSSGCRSSSPTTSTTPSARVASSTTS